MSNSAINHLLLDLDGTLVDGDGIKVRLDFVVRMANSWPEPWGLLRTMRAFRRMRDAADQISSKETNQTRMIRAFAQTFDLPEEKAQEVLEAAVQKVFPTLQSYFFPVDGAAEFVAWAVQNYPLILATDPIWIPEAVKLRVQWAGLSIDAFRSFTHAQNMHYCKPSLNYYREVLEQGGLVASQCLLLGNDRKNDLPASELGIRVFLLSGSSKDTGKPYYEKISVKPGAAAAWQGNFGGLKKLLETDILVA